MQFRYGPVELSLIDFADGPPDLDVWAAVETLVSAGVLRVLDAIWISKDAQGNLTFEEEVSDAFPLLRESEESVDGLIGDEDMHGFSEAVEPGSSALLVAWELLYARELADRLGSSGGTVLRSTRIPAPVVNALINTIEKN